MDASPRATSSKQSKNALDAAYEIANAAKYRAYERDYLRWIHHKYFSDQVLGGTDPVYEHTTTIEDFVIKASKSPPLKSFSESKASLESTSAAGTDPPPPTSGRKKQARR